MGFGGKMTASQNDQTSAMFRVSRLPLIRSALQSVNSVYSGAKGRYPLLRMVGGIAEVGVRNMSVVALRQATPLLQTLEPQIEVANTFALTGLNQLEKTFPILNQSTEEVISHLKDAFFLTLDDAQLLVVDGLDGALDQLERLLDGVWGAVRNLQDSQVGQATASGLDDLLSRLEQTTSYYMPLPPTLRREWEMRVQEYEDEDDSDEPGMWTRIRSLLLRLSLQLYHRMMKIREQLQGALQTLGIAADTVGLGQVLELIGELLQYLHTLMVALVYKAEGARETSVSRVREQAMMLVELRPVQQVLEMPVLVQELLKDLQELSKILLQLIINITPLYNMMQQPTDQEVEDFLNQQDFSADSSSRRSSANSLFLKAMDGRPRRRKSLYSRSVRSPSMPQSPDGATGLRPDSDVDGLSLMVPPEANSHRRPSATDMLLTPLKQIVSQSQKAFEYLSPNSSAEPTSLDD